jgi:hypothetical protein
MTGIDPRTLDDLMAYAKVLKIIRKVAGDTIPVRWERPSSQWEEPEHIEVIACDIRDMGEAIALQGGTGLLELYYREVYERSDAQLAATLSDAWGQVPEWPHGHPPRLDQLGKRIAEMDAEDAAVDDADYQAQQAEWHKANRGFIP